MGFIKMAGLNNKQVAVRPYGITFIEEGSIEGIYATNIHYDNGRWITVAGTVDEVCAILDTKPEEQDDQKNIEKWKRHARMRREAQLEIEAAMKAVDLRGKVKSYKMETAEDGSRRVEMYLEPINEGDQDGQSED
jgi:hypothetical protein